MSSRRSARRSSHSARVASPATTTSARGRRGRCATSTCTCSSVRAPRWRRRTRPPERSRRRSPAACATPTYSSTSSPRTASGPGPRSRPPPAGSAQIDRRRRGDGDEHHGVALVVGDQQDDRRDQGGGHGEEPGNSGERHGRLFSPPPMTSALTPADARARLRDLAPQVREALVLTRRGRVLAGPADLAPAAKDLLRATGAPALEAATASGTVFTARSERHATILIARRGALAAPVLFGARPVLY